MPALFLLDPRWHAGAMASPRAAGLSAVCPVDEQVDEKVCKRVWASVQGHDGAIQGFLSRPRLLLCVSYLLDANGSTSELG